MKRIFYFRVPFPKTILLSNHFHKNHLYKINPFYEKYLPRFFVRDCSNVCTTV